MKKILAAVLCVVLLIGAVGITSFAANETQLTVTTTSTEVRRGDEVTVVVEVSGDNAFTSMGYIPYTDSEYFTVTGGTVIAEGTALAEFTPADGGVLLFNSSAAHSGVFFEFTIKIKDNAPFDEFVITDPTGVMFNNGVVHVINEPTLRVVCDHDFGGWVEVDDATHKRECSICGASVDAPHAWDAGTVTKPASCKEPGVMTYTCECGATKTAPIDNSNEPHSHGAWTKVDDDKHQRECPVCGDIETADHAWDNGTVTTKPNCKEPGVMTYACACGATKTAPIDNANEPHDYVWSEVDADNHKGVCSVCGDEKEEAHVHGTEWDGDATNHYHACVCGNKVDVAAHEWDNGTVTEKATCDKEGVMTYTCACGTSKTEKIAKIDHAWDNGKVTKEPTKNENGVKTYTCSECGETKTEIIDKTLSSDTGDKSPVVLFAALMVVAFGGIVAIVFNRKKFIV